MKSVKTSVKIRDDLWRAAKLRAMDEGKYLETVIGEALAEYLKPWNLSEFELKRRGVSRVKESVWLKCDSCGKAWSAFFGRGKGSTRDYWKCPKGCNKDADRTETGGKDGRE